MSENLTLDDLVMPVRVLRLLAADFGHLPAPTVGISPIYPDRLELSLHSGLPGFETWREALAIAPEDVNYRVQRGGRTGVLRSTATYAGVELELIGYGDVAVPVTVEAGAA
ncbi:hypothetical protein [Streptomyces mirabilis]|uniref:hypothetical protein n=1 Tax=Streptomyces mirabilis TaxID=68239 RepID=UPI0036D9CCF0